MKFVYVYKYTKDGVVNFVLSEQAIEEKDFQLSSIDEYDADGNTPSIYVFREGSYQFSKESNHFVRVA